MNKIMPDFFSNETENLELVEDAKHVLLRLSKFFQIVILTNLPHKDKNKRIKALEKNKLYFPVITNNGVKGDAVKKILEKNTSLSFFIDDMPLNIDSVSKKSPKTNCIHFVQDIRINKLMPTPKSARIKLTNWQDIEKYVMRNFEVENIEKN